MKEMKELSLPERKEPSLRKQCGFWKGHKWQYERLEHSVVCPNWSWLGRFAPTGYIKEYRICLDCPKKQIRLEADIAAGWEDVDDKEFDEILALGMKQREERKK